MNPLNSIRRLLPHDAKVRIAEALCHPTMGDMLAKVFRDQIPTPLGLIDTSSAYVDPVIKAEIFWGFYESSERRFIDAHLPKGLDVIELGASLGVVSATAARKLEAKRKLVCVEANPFLLRTLRNNLEQHASHLRWQMIHGAVSSGSGPDVAFEVTESSLGSKLSSSDSPRGATVRVPRFTLSQILAQAEIHGQYALVTDIEGAEIDIFLDDSDALSQCRTLLGELHIVESHGQTWGIDQTIHFLTQKLGFSLTAQYGPVVALTR